MARVKEVDIEAPASTRWQGAAPIDVREAHEYEAGHVPGSQWLPLGMITAGLPQVLRGGQVTLICASGNRSLVAAEILTRHGFDAASVAGGTAASEHAGHALKCDTPTRH